METIVSEGPLRLYDVVVNGNKTQMRLNDADAEFYGEKATLAENQADQPAQPEPVRDENIAAVTGEKRREPVNKARTADNK
jgi:hypothetical protein